MLAVTLRLLQEHGYDGLTVDAVASAARASKATVYRRWPSKAELVLAAFIEGVRQVAVPPNTGTLRGDLLTVGRDLLRANPPARQHAARGACRGVAPPRTQRRAATSVHRSAQSLDPTHPAPGRRAGGDRPCRHHRRALGPVARVPRFPGYQHRSAAQPSDGATACRRLHHPRPHPIQLVKSVRTRLLYSTVQYRTVIPIDPPRVIEGDRVAR